MNITNSSRKEVGALGEDAAAKYLQKQGFRILERNFMRKAGELDIVARKGDTLHFIEVKTVACHEFEDDAARYTTYNPAENLHAYKISKVARMAEWYVAEKGWEGDWQVDAALVWLRYRDGLARVEHIAQIV